MHLRRGDRKRNSKSSAEHLADAEALVRRFGAVPNRAWLIKNGYLTLYNIMAYRESYFAHLPKQPKEPRSNLQPGRFSDIQIRRIRQDTRNPKILASVYGVSHQHITSIRQRKSYAMIV